MWALSLLAVFAYIAACLGVPPRAGDAGESQVALSGIRGTFNFTQAFARDQREFLDKYGKLHDLDAVFNLHKTLIETQSVSQHEAAVFAAIEPILAQLGLTTARIPLPDSDSRYCLYAYYGDAAKHRKVLLTSHLDTVPPFIPYKYDSESGTVFGRGANDDKGAVTNQIFAVKELLSSGEIAEEDFALLFVVGEEIGGDGMKAAVDWIKQNKIGLWDSVVFGEPTENKLAVGHKGNFQFELTALGKAAHSGYPHLGVSSNEILVDFLHEMMQNTGTKYPVSETLGETTVNVGVMHGGIAVNVLPSRSEASVFFRVSADLAQLTKTVYSMLHRHNAKWARKHPDYVSEKPSEDSVGGPFLYMSKIVTKQPQYLDYKVPGFESIIVAFATDIPLFDIPTKKRFLYGPGSITSAHGDNENVSIWELVENLEGYKNLVRHLTN